MAETTTTHDDYRVQLEAYSGPLDLLLFLVKRHEIDLNDIPIAELTDQYMSHLKLIQAIDVDRVGEFLVMAATLLEIKSQMLMPRQPGEGVEQEGGPSEQQLDPRYELMQQLLAYKHYKDAAIRLEHQHADWSMRFPAHPVPAPRSQSTGGPDPDSAPPIELDLDDVHILDLCEAFARLLDAIGQSSGHEVTYDDTPVSLHAEDIHDRLTREGPMTLQQIFVGRSTQSELIGLFLATLELVRQKLVRVRQSRPGEEIRLELIPENEQSKVEHQDEPADWRNPETGEIEYDWPDPDAKARSEKRAKLRAERLAKREFDQPGDEKDEDAFDAGEFQFEDEDEEGV